MPRFAAVAIAALAVIGVVATAGASPSGTTASLTASQDVNALAQRLKHDEAAIHKLSRSLAALKRKHVIVDIHTGGINFGNPAFNQDGEQALCSPGETIVGGGAGWGAGAGLSGDHLTDSQPITNPPGWIAGGIHDPSEFNPFNVYALCIR